MHIPLRGANTLDLAMLAKEMGLVLMDLYLELKLTLTFNLVVMLRAYLNGALGSHTSM